ncbi:ParA family partition ATPase [Roseitranquillus sediminis]|uniref:ParA family partition ATPase n=1 Tax=Roseitranquillus sediminis TaxID=2809051 RepID=UPI001D0C0848|nr:ParA family partition ATPase [Roseitranquillus sediminis]MBM9596374.1 ParA family protein [Roseitranquillus sediminis]
MGQVISLAQQKGGSGKTTLALNIACAAIEDGMSVALLDTDPQGSLGQWFMRRRQAMDPGMSFSTSSAWGVAYECDKLRGQSDIVIVDTPPKVDADLRPALRESSLILVPVASSHLDLWATESVLDLAAREKRRSAIVLNRSAPRARLMDEVVAALGDIEAPRLVTMLGNRVVYAEATGQGRGVVEMTRAGKAAEEVRALWAEVRGMID